MIGIRDPYKHVCHKDDEIFNGESSKDEKGEKRMTGSEKSVTSNETNASSETGNWEI